MILSFQCKVSECRSLLDAGACHESICEHYMPLYASGKSAIVAYVSDDGNLLLVVLKIQMALSFVARFYHEILYEQ